MLIVENSLVNAINSDYYEQDSFKYSFSNLKKTFSLFHLNISSLNLHFEELHLAFNHLENPFDVIGISETKLSDSSKINDLVTLSIINPQNHFVVVQLFM